VTRELVDALAAPVREGAALCTAAPQIEARGWGGAALSGILDHGPHSLAALDRMSVGAPAVCGKACALGPAAQEWMPRLTRVAGEDLELSLRLHAAGHRVALAAAPAPVHSGRLGLRATLDRMTRWLQVLRAHRPALFPTVPLLIAPTVPLLAASLIASAPLATVLSIELLFLRVALAVALRRSRRAPWAWLLGELVLLVAFARALVEREVVWRGQRYRLAAGGAMR
jgi:hypothetical protein